MKQLKSIVLIMMLLSACFEVNAQTVKIMGSPQLVVLDSNLQGPLDSNLKAKQERYQKTANINQEILAEEEDSPNQFRLYPNPARNFVNLHVGISANQILTITDYKGKIVYQGQFNENLKTIDLSKLPAGLYIVTVDGEDRTLVSKIVLQ